MTLPEVIYLDQNKWIDLAACLDRPDRFPERRAIAESLIEAIREQRAIVPLTFGNMFETHKINDVRRRKLLAEVQSDFSRGLVFRGRASLLRVQLQDSLASAFSLAPSTRAPFWFLSNLFFECVADFDSGMLGPKFTIAICDVVRANPSGALFNYLMAPADAHRKAVVRQHSEGSRELIAKIEARRTSVRDKPQSARRRAYGQLLLRGDSDAVQEVAREMNLSAAELDDPGSERVQALIEGVPLFVVERELVVKTEGEERPIDENDLRDLAAFDIVLPYADTVVGEKAFLNRARQARLGERYRTRLLTDFKDLFP